NSVLYVLNNQMSPKWFYNYDSSLTRAQREMTHHLVTYVFRRLPGRDQSQQHWQLQGPQHQEHHIVAVLARHASPGFLLVSYRRSGAAAGNPGCALPAIETPVEILDVACSELLSASSVVHQHQQQHLQQQQWLQQQRLQERLQHHQEGQQHHRNAQHQQDGQDQDRRLPQMKHALFSNSAPFVREAAHSTDENKSGSANQTPLQDAPADAYWQQIAGVKAPNFREKGQQLLILWYFLQHTSLKDLGLNENTTKDHMQSHWLRAAAALRTLSPVPETQLESVVTSFLTSIFKFSSDHTCTTDFEQATIRFSGYLLLRAASSQVVWQLLRVGFHVTSGGMTQRLLQEKFASLILDLWNVFNDILRDTTGGGYNRLDETLFSHQTGALSALVDNVLSIVYQQPRFGVLRAKVSALLLDRETPYSITGALNRAFQAFMTQIEETKSLSALKNPQRSHHQRGFGKIGGGGLQGLLQCAWNHRWLLEPGSVRTVGVTSELNCTASLLTAAQFIGEFGCIDVKVTDGGEYYMSIRTGFSHDDGVEPMELILDGRPRRFQALPSGISSRIVTAGGWSVGDYAATFSDKEHSIEMHFYFSETRGLEENSMRTRDDSVDAVLMVRRASLFLTLEKAPGCSEAMNAADPRDLFLVVQGTLYASTHSQPISGDCIPTTDISNSDNDALWNKLVWIPMVEFQAGYVAL
ncbi:hypothetical protein PHMEG_00025852, partial [Phytophthora megakarya]